MRGSSRRRDRWPKRVIDVLLRLSVRSEKVEFSEIRAASPSRILVVHQHNELGDMLLATPAFAALRASFPEAEIRIVASPTNAAVVRDNPDLDGCFVFNKAACLDPRNAIALVRRLRTFGPELAFVWNTVSFSATSAWIATLSGARWIVGTDSKPFGWQLSSSLYSVELPATERETIPAFERPLAALASIGIEPESKLLRLSVNSGALETGSAFLGKLNTPFVAVHPGAGKHANRWNTAGFAHVVRALQSRCVTVWLVEGPADADAVASLQSMLENRCAVLRGAELDVVAAALSLSRLVLANDTGILHVAAAVGAEVVGLFGPTSGELWAPPGVHVTVIQSSDEAMSSIEAEEVLAVLQSKLDA